VRPRARLPRGHDKILLVKQLTEGSARGQKVISPTRQRSPADQASGGPPGRPGPLIPIQR